MHFSAVAPPRGERGLKRATESRRRMRAASRSPSWGAWIETPVDAYCSIDMKSRSPSWGAWIETRRRSRLIPRQRVAPPRGERGLKHLDCGQRGAENQVAPPRGERGLKLPVPAFSHAVLHVAPPRGERGLKLIPKRLIFLPILSLPLVGSVD